MYSDSKISLPRENSSGEMENSQCEEERAQEESYKYKTIYNNIYHITYNMLTVDFLWPVGDMQAVTRTDCRHDLVSVEF